MGKYACWVWRVKCCAVCGVVSGELLGTGRCVVGKMELRSFDAGTFVSTIARESDLILHTGAVQGAFVGMITSL